MKKLPEYLIPSWLRELKQDHLSKVYDLLLKLMEAAGKLPNTPEKEEYVRLVELKFAAVEQVLIQSINNR
jgi:hypothetical protein